MFFVCVTIDFMSNQSSRLNGKNGNFFLKSLTLESPPARGGLQDVLAYAPPLQEEGQGGGWGFKDGSL